MRAVSRARQLATRLPPLMPIARAGGVNRVRHRRVDQSPAKMDVAVKIGAGAIQLLVALRRSVGVRLGNAAEIEPGAHDLAEAAAGACERGLKALKHLQRLAVAAARGGIRLHPAAVNPADAVIADGQGVGIKALDARGRAADRPGLDREGCAAAGRLADIIDDRPFGPEFRGDIRSYSAWSAGFRRKTVWTVTAIGSGCCSSSVRRAASTSRACSANGPRHSGASMATSRTESPRSTNEE